MARKQRPGRLLRNIRTSKPGCIFVNILTSETALRHDGISRNNEVIKRDVYGLGVIRVKAEIVFFSAGIVFLASSFAGHGVFNMPWQMNLLLGLFLTCLGLMVLLLKKISEALRDRDHPDHNETAGPGKK